MSLPTDPVLTSWNRDEMLSFARRRGTHLRRRRLAVQAGIALAAVVMVAVPIGLVSGDQSASRLDTVDRPTITSSDESGPADETGPSDQVPAGTGAPPSPAATDARGAKLSSGLKAPVTTTTAAASAPAQLAPCDSSEVLLTTTTDRASYGVAVPVEVTATVRNISDRVCAPPTNTVISIAQDATGRSFYDYAVDPAAIDVWEPGQAFDAVFVWDQSCSSCAAGIATRGGYTAHVRWTWGRSDWTSNVSFQLS